MSPPILPAGFPPLPGLTQEAAQAALGPLEAMINSTNATLSSLNSAASSVLSAMQAPFRTASPAPITQPVAALIENIRRNVIPTLPGGQAPRRETDQRTTQPGASSLVGVEPA